MSKTTVVQMLLLASLAATAFPQAPVVAVPDPEALVKSKDKQLEANKKLVLDMVRDFLTAHKLDTAEKYFTPEYIQHNPNAASGRDAVVQFFKALFPNPEKNPPKMQIVKLVAEGDMVIVAFPREYKDPKDPSKTYTTTWFDMYRIANGKIAEHWDPATK